MESFVQRHASKVMGSVSGFDRVRLRGTLRWLSNVRGMMGYLSAMNVLLQDFREFAKGVTGQIRRARKRMPNKKGVP